uniref:Uncharacterized protein n=1 Tax=Romanomermis culicivorax TaxID=13658 RepID=A0A915IW18_ROMCU
MTLYLPRKPSANRLPKMGMDVNEIEYEQCTHSVKRETFGKFVAQNEEGGLGEFGLGIFDSGWLGVHYVRLSKKLGNSQTKKDARAIFRTQPSSETEIICKN